MGIQSLHAPQERVLEVLLGNSEALNLLESARLLLPLGSGNFEGLVLGFDARNLSLDFLLPSLTLLGLALVRTVLETSNLVKLGFLFHLEQGLLDCL